MGKTKKSYLSSINLESNFYPPVCNVENFIYICTG
jgi:hypothetical protein